MIDLATPYRINVFTCSEKHQTITRDIGDGVTPFMILCGHGNCRKMAFSAYYEVPQIQVATHEWFKPSAEELKRMEPSHPGITEYIAGGALLLRKIEEADPCE